MKKIICLILAMVTVFAFVSCGEPCEVCTDANGDGKCDVCGLDYASPADIIFAMVAESNPTGIKTITEASKDGLAYIGEYTTTIYEDGSFDYVVKQNVPNHVGDDSEEAAEPIEHTVKYKDGIYTLDGVVVSGAPDIAYLNIKAEITAENIGQYTVNSTGRELTATLTAEQCDKIFGIKPSAESISLTVTTNGTRLWKITISYEDANGVVVTAQTAYDYTPVSSEA